ncbi:MAG: hypothetical protein OQK82_06380 [Candidatus Pacearchaeota archaeon]|nr:hypothetical protein [Candidatus Pacearchaeota archaeon]
MSLSLGDFSSQSRIELVKYGLNPDVEVMSKGEFKMSDLVRSIKAEGKPIFMKGIQVNYKGNYESNNFFHQGFLSYMHEGAWRFIPFNPSIEVLPNQFKFPLKDINLDDDKFSFYNGKTRVTVSPFFSNGCANVVVARNLRKNGIDEIFLKEVASAYDLRFDEFYEKSDSFSQWFRRGDKRFNLEVKKRKNEVSLKKINIFVDELNGRLLKDLKKVVGLSKNCEYDGNGTFSFNNSFYQTYILDKMINRILVGS